MINNLLISKMNEIKNALDYGKYKKLYLKNYDVLRVSRYVKNSLNDRDFSHQTVHDAISNKQWDTCRGTMSYSINIATDKDNQNPNIIYGIPVYFDGIRAYIIIKPNIDE